jgi:hypothetical protein
MQQILSALPKGLLAFLALFGGILFIVFSDPPKTVCDAQKDVFKRNQMSFLYLDPKFKTQKTTKFERLFEYCKNTNTPGGCLELFQLTKRLLDDLNAVPLDCRSEVASSSEVKKVITYLTELLVRLAWGSQPPQTYAQKMGWLDVADVSLFCQLQVRYSEYFGMSAWEGLREKLLKDLPGAETMTRSQVWDFSILSENCSRYP